MPDPLKAEHYAFHDELLKATKNGGELGMMASQIDNMPNPQFKIVEESSGENAPQICVYSLQRVRTVEMDINDIKTVTEKPDANN